VDADVKPAGTVHVQFVSPETVLNCRTTLLPLVVEVGEHVVLALGLLDDPEIVEDTVVKVLLEAVTVIIAEVPAFKPETITWLVPEVELLLPTATVPAVVVAEYE
jgi:hypothetical protein